MTHTRMCQECPVSLEKLSFFFIQVKIIQVLVFDNWHPLKQASMVQWLFHVPYKPEIAGLIRIFLSLSDETIN